jgi:hypothetical protein
MKFTKSILALYLASLSLAAPANQPRIAQGGDKGAIKSGAAIKIGSDPKILGRGLIGTPSPSLPLIESELDRTQNRSPPRLAPY